MPVLTFLVPPVVGVAVHGDALAVTVQLLPDSVTLTLVPACAAFGGALAALAGVARGVSRPRVERLLLAGNLVGAAVGLAALALAVAAHGLS